MIIFKLAYRNVAGRGLMTWINVAVLSFAYVLIIAHQGIFSGMLKFGMKAMIDDEISGGQYWHANYDPYDPMSYDDSHGKIPSEFSDENSVPILIRQASIYPQGRVQSILLKGINPNQKILKIPTEKLITDEDILPILAGTRMAKSNSLKIGDYITIRWRDAKGTFDATEGKIAAFMHTNVPTIDQRQLWVPLDNLQNMTELKDEATIIIIPEDKASSASDMVNWRFKTQAFLLKDLTDMVASKRIWSGMLYFILLLLVMLAVFDTQVLAIFRRRKEIGTLMALGMTRLKVIFLFTLEGAMNGILAVGIAAIYGTPLIYYFAKTGMSLPEAAEDYGFPLVRKLFPSYSITLVIITVSIIMITVTIVSYLPSRKISKLKPTDALRGK
ncbi:MAG: FtsX-like permease family protein [Elusimicrobiota bacterium]